jgi:hypothetical protein
VIQLIYRSAASAPFSERELTNLLQRARDNNAQFGLTGLLLYENGSFLQVLEGEREPLLAVYGRILKDPRHQRVTKLLEQELDKRRFGDWQMGFVSVTRLGLAIPGYSEFLRLGGEAAASGDQALRVLSQFREGRFRSKVDG